MKLKGISMLFEFWKNGSPGLIVTDFIMSHSETGLHIGVGQEFPVYSLTLS